MVPSPASLSGARDGTVVDFRWKIDGKSAATPKSRRLAPTVQASGTVSYQMM